ncbi:unnamed protein product, partial [Mesorhabditis belari]|uniref:Uncharacterized protein n=1 Tax=Mesorhabditis belari TaxID=2138241 RepID=A0AAF3ERG6_9BILA
MFRNSLQIFAYKFVTIPAFKKLHRLANWMRSQDVSPMCGRCVLFGLYLIVLLETLTVGLLGFAAWREFNQIINLRVHERDTNAVIILTIVVVALLGYAVSLPCLCFATHTQSSSAVVPYLSWRLLFNTLIVIIVISQTLLGRRKRAAPFSSTLFGRQLTIAIAEFVFGTAFLIVAHLAYQHYERLRLRRHESDEDLVETHKVLYAYA